MGRDLRADLATRPAVDVVAVVKQLVAQRGTCLRRQLLGDHAEWGHHEENTARLLDHLNHQVEHQWTDRTTDPDDPEVIEARKQAKREGRKPPTEPPVRPVAMRPESITDDLVQRYLDTISTPTGRGSASSPLAEFDALIGAL